MAARTFDVKKDNNTRVKTKGGVQGKGTGGSLAVGRYLKEYTYRAYLEFDLDWDNVGEIVGAQMHFTLKNNFFPDGAGPNAQAQIYRVTKEWSEGGSSWAAGNKVYSPPATGQRWRSEAITPGVGNTFTIGCLDLVMKWAPAGVKKFGTNQRGKGLKNHGVVLQSIYQDRTKASFEVASRENATVSHRPTLVLDYIPKVTKPAHSRGNPENATATSSPNFVVQYTDSNPDDFMTRVNIRLRKKGGTKQWQTQRAVTAGERISAEAKVEVQDVLPPGVTLLGEATTHYEWMARVKDSEGNWSDWNAAWKEFWVTNLSPILTADAPEMGTFRTLDNVYLKGTWSDPDGGFISAVQLQTRTRQALDSPNWDDATGLFWDSGVLSATASEVSSGKVSRLYGGEFLPVGYYSTRFRVMDSLGAWSAWTLTNFGLSVAYEPVPGEVPYLSGYAKKTPKWRIRLFDMNSDRGPGKCVATIDDAANVGASQMANDVGEFYFTIGSNHPQVGECEPYQRHYSFEQYRGSGWAPIFQGILTDFDANQDDVIVYGTDYMGLLAQSIDIRASQGKQPDLPVEKGGSKYNSKRIDYIIIDQLRQAKNMNNAPTGFITVDSNEFDKTAETVTIFSSFKQRLDFIIGLLQSAKSGTGRKARVWPVRIDYNSYKWRFRMEAGTDRPDLRLSYGELVQGYRVLVMGDFATKVHGIGKMYDEVKPRYFSKAAPGLNLQTWGLTQRAAVWSDLSDNADLKRRVYQIAAEVGKVGKRIALGLRVTGIEPFDGWNLLDSVPVEIDHGAVDTDKYGSGLWTIHGVEYRVFPDGHDELTLAVLPKEDDIAPDDDLIDSDPIKPKEDWTSGPKDPTCEDLGEYYYQTTTGITYKRCEDSSSCYCPIEGPGPYLGRTPHIYDDFEREVPETPLLVPATYDAFIRAEDGREESTDGGGFLSSVVPYEATIGRSWDMDNTQTPTDEPFVLTPNVTYMRLGSIPWHWGRWTTAGCGSTGANNNAFGWRDTEYWWPWTVPALPSDVAGVWWDTVWLNDNLNIYNCRTNLGSIDNGYEARISSVLPTAMKAGTVLDTFFGAKGGGGRGRIWIPKSLMPPVGETMYLGIGPNFRTIEGTPNAGPCWWGGIAAQTYPTRDMIAGASEGSSAQTGGMTYYSWKDEGEGRLGRTPPGAFWDGDTAWQGDGDIWYVDYDEQAAIYAPGTIQDTAENIRQYGTFYDEDGNVVTQHPDGPHSRPYAWRTTFTSAKGEGSGSDRNVHLEWRGNVLEGQDFGGLAWVELGDGPNGPNAIIHVRGADTDELDLGAPLWGEEVVLEVDFRFGVVKAKAYIAGGADPGWQVSAPIGSGDPLTSFIALGSIAMPGDIIKATQLDVMSQPANDWGRTTPTNLQLIEPPDPSGFHGDQPYTGEGLTDPLPAIGVTNGEGYVESSSAVGGSVELALGIGDNPEPAPWNFDKWGFFMRFRVQEEGLTNADGQRYIMLRWQREGQSIAAYVALGDTHRLPGCGVDPLSTIPPSSEAKHVQTPVPDNVWMYCRIWFSMTSTKISLWREDEELGEPREWLVRDVAAHPYEDSGEEDEDGDGFPPLIGDPPDPSTIEPDEPLEGLRQSLDFMISVGNGDAHPAQRVEVDWWGYYVNEGAALSGRIEKELAGYGDGVTTTFFTDLPWVEGTLAVFYNGLFIEALTASDPAARSFTFDYPPSGPNVPAGLPGAKIEVSYTVARSN